MSKRAKVHSVKQYTYSSTNMHTKIKMSFDVYGMEVSYGRKTHGDMIEADDELDAWRTAMVIAKRLKYGFRLRDWARYDRRK